MEEVERLLIPLSVCMKSWCSALDGMYPSARLGERDGSCGVLQKRGRSVRARITLEDFLEMEVWQEQ